MSNNGTRVCGWTNFYWRPSKPLDEWNWTNIWRERLLCNKCELKLSHEKISNEYN